MDPYNVVLIQPDGYPHAMALREIALLLHYSLQSLGLQSKATINILDPDAVNVLVGYHVLRKPSMLKDRRYIIYQLEQLGDRPEWFEPEIVDMLKGAQAIWDYSLENIQVLRDQGLSNLKHLPIGFHPNLQTIPKAEEDVDVLFYGSINDRREKILADLRPRCRVQELFQIYGPERDAWIARSKIILNIHFYETRIMEQARLSYLLNNGRFIVSEDSAANPFQDMIAAVPYDRVVESCLMFLQDAAARQSQAQRGLDLFRRRPMTEYLRPLIS